MSATQTTAHSEALAETGPLERHPHRFLIGIGRGLGQVTRTIHRGSSWIWNGTFLGTVFAAKKIGTGARRIQTWRELRRQARMLPDDEPAPEPVKPKPVTKTAEKQAAPQDESTPVVSAPRKASKKAES